MMNPTKKLALVALATCVSALTVSSASAQNPGFQAGDLFLGFQTAASSSYVVASLGDVTTYRNATSNITNIANVGSALSSQFGGASWFNNTDLFMGAGAVFTNDADEGDISLTISGPRTSPLGAEGVPQGFGYQLTTGQVQQGANALTQANSGIESQGTGAISTIAKSASFIDYDDKNPITAGSNVQGTAYNVFAAGVQTQFTAGNIGNFGGIAAEAALDLYTIDPSGSSTYEGSLVIDNLGNISFIVAPVPEPSTALGLGLLVGLVGLVKRRRTEVVA